MRTYYPLAPYETFLRVERIEASKPWHIVESGDRAVVSSKQPVPGFVPILLHRVDGLWRVDLVETWKNLFTGPVRIHPANSNQPYAFGIPGADEAPWQDLAAYDLGDWDVEQVLAQVRQKEGGFFRFLEAELLFRNCFLPDMAYAQYRRAIEESPSAPAFRIAFASRASYLRFHDLAVEALADALPPEPRLLAAAYESGGRGDRAIQVLTKALSRDPYDASLLAEVVRLRKQHDPGSKVLRKQEKRLAELLALPEKRHLPLEVTFDPELPPYNTDTPTQVGQSTVFDHSDFSLRITNPSDRAVEIVHIDAETYGDERRSGLGDIKDWFAYPTAANRLEPGGSIFVERTWGFSVDTGHRQLTYAFGVCWREEGEKALRCGQHNMHLFSQ